MSRREIGKDCLYPGGCIALAVGDSVYCAVHQDPAVRAAEWATVPPRPFGVPTRNELERDADGLPCRLWLGVRR